ncbi:hypothetical protein ND991_23035 [Gordonia sputi]|nr:hypothetical protein [Gordonia sputi]MCM3898074.1 hypothetical protein [Gordonia sputi]
MKREFARGQWVSRAEVAEVPFTAFTSKAKRLQVSGRLVVRRIPDFAAEGDGLFDVWRFWRVPREPVRVVLES